MNVIFFHLLFPDVILPSNNLQNDCRLSQLIIPLSVNAAIILVFGELVTVNKFNWAILGPQTASVTQPIFTRDKTYLIPAEAKMIA